MVAVFDWLYSMSYWPKFPYFIIICHTFHYTSVQGYLDIQNHTVLQVVVPAIPLCPYKI